MVDPFSKCWMPFLMQLSGVSLGQAVYLTSSAHPTAQDATEPSGSAEVQTEFQTALENAVAQLYIR